MTADRQTRYEVELLALPKNSTSRTKLEPVTRFFVTAMTIDAARFLIKTRLGRTYKIRAISSTGEKSFQAIVEYRQ